MQDWHAAELIEQANAGLAEDARVAVDSGGNATAVWVQFDGVRFNVWANRFEPGLGWGVPIDLQLNQTAEAQHPFVVAGPDGDVTVLWEQFDGIRTNIWAARFVTGTGWSGAQLIESENSGGAQNPVAAAGPDGNLTAVWRQWDGTRFNIWANHFSREFGWDAPTLIETEDSGDADAAWVAVDGAEQATAVWLQRNGTRYDLWANRYLPGSGWASALLLETDDGGSAMTPRVAADLGGNVTAVWSQRNTTKLSIWANRFTPGVGWGGRTLLETDESGDAYRPTAATSADGGAIVVWEQSDGTSNNIWAASYVPGSAWGNAVVLETDSGFASLADIAADQAGNATVAWNQFDGTRYNILANRFSVTTGWGASRLIETDNNGDATGPKVAVDEGGSAVAVWLQSDGTRTNIWANRYGWLPNITVASDPAGLVVIVDGVNRSTPFSFLCTSDGQVDISSPQGGPATRYAFSNWSDGGARQHPVRCLEDTVVIARFTTEFLITISTDPPNLALRIDEIPWTTTASFWWSDNSSHVLNASAPQVVGRVRYAFDAWSDGASINRTFRAAGPSQLSARFAPSEFQVLLDTSPSGLEVAVEGFSTPSPRSYWWAVNSTHQLAALSPQGGPPGSRFRFVAWSDGGAANHSVRATAALDLVASFAAEYEVTVSAGGPFEILVDGQRASTPYYAWWEGSSTHSLDIPPETQGANGSLTRYGFARWSDNSSRNHSITAVSPLALFAFFAPAEYLVTVSTEPAGLEVTVNGSLVNAPLTLWWPAGEGLPLQVETPQLANRTRFSLLSWLPLGISGGSVPVTEPTNFTALFATEYEAIVNGSMAGLWLTVDGAAYVTPFHSWWAAGSTHSLRMASPQPLFPGARLVWHSWDDGAPQNRSVLASEPLSLVASVTLQFHLTSPRGSLACDAVECWFDAGTSARFSVQSPLDGPVGTRHVLNLTGQAANGTAMEVVLTMVGPIDLGALWKTEYLLTVVSEFGTVTGGGWYESGSAASFAVTPSEVEVTGDRVRFLGWSGDLTSPTASSSITMDRPRTVVALWERLPSGAVDGSAFKALAFLLIGVVGVALFGRWRWGRGGRNRASSERKESFGFRPKGPTRPGEPPGGP